MRRCWAKIVTLVVGIGPCVSASAGERSPFPSGQPACFARSYDQQHLAGHPGQRVTDIFLAANLPADPLREDGGGASAPETEAEAGVLPQADRPPDAPPPVSLLVRVRDRADLLVQDVECSGSSANFTCGVECDGGSVSGKVTGDRLMLTNHGVSLVGSCDGAKVWLENDAENRLFRLSRVEAETCEAAVEAARPSLADGGPPLSSALASGDKPCFAATMPPSEVGSKLTFLKTGDNAFAIRARRGDGDTKEVRLECYPDLYTWSCEDPTATAAESSASETSDAPPSAIVLARAGTDRLELSINSEAIVRRLGGKPGGAPLLFARDRSDACAAP